MPNYVDFGYSPIVQNMYGGGNQSINLSYNIPLNDYSTSVTNFPSGGVPIGAPRSSNPLSFLDGLGGIPGGDALGIGDPGGVGGIGSIVAAEAAQKKQEEEALCLLLAVALISRSKNDAPPEDEIRPIRSPQPRVADTTADRAAQIARNDEAAPKADEKAKT